MGGRGEHIGVSERQEIAHGWPKGGGEGQRNVVVIRGGIKHYDGEHSVREEKGCRVQEELTEQQPPQGRKRQRIKSTHHHHR